MTTDNMIYKRRSIRDFRKEPLPDEVITSIVEDASHAASWQNTQSWQVYVAKGQALAQIHTQFLAAAQADQASVTDLTTPHMAQRSALSKSNIEQWRTAVEAAVGQGDAAWAKFAQAGTDFFNAPAVAFITASSQTSEFTIYDMGAFGQTLMLAAADRGVGSIAAYNLVKYPEIIKKVLAIPATEEVVIGIGLGYASDSPINDVYTKRMSVANILHIKD
ncbi:nitroreductase [Agrilactobacillus yilanensis]|uniref:Nitroreductase n=1 Tax=Agrilactobacillus yilanensis TaxID=2485997 RepID=A0ABW4J816_9LACO|nr:nitroreductase [Agrilactobacillus yilanensis]